MFCFCFTELAQDKWVPGCDCQRPADVAQGDRLLPCGQLAELHRVREATSEPPHQRGTSQGTHVSTTAHWRGNPHCPSSIVLIYSPGHHVFTVVVC